MDKLDHFLQNNNLCDPDDIDSLLELASLARELVCEKHYASINRLIRCTIERSYHEAFRWLMEILQESLESAGCKLDSFECHLGKSIPDYNGFIQILQVDLNESKNDAKTVCDETGEVQSFFNILTYETGYRNICLVSSENFDTKDNDYILYKLRFTKE